MSQQTIVWAPQGSQEIFLTCPLFEVLYEGTRGPGKTDALIMDFCQFVGRGYGEAWRGILFRQTYKQLGDVITKTKKWIPRIWSDAKYNHTDTYWSWPSGERLYLRHFMRDDDYYEYHGHEYPWVGWEELCNWASATGYHRMISVCRSSEKGMPRHYRATTNPYGPGHNWVAQRWRLNGIPRIGASRIIRDSYDLEGNLEPPRVSIHGDISENKILLEADPTYIDNLRIAARTDAEFRAWRYGDWSVVAGGMFDDVWDPKVHIIKPFPIPTSWRIDRSFDWGSSKPFSVGWWAESDGTDYKNADGKTMSSVKGDLFRIAEWYGWNGQANEGKRSLAVDIAKNIVEREVKWGIRNRVKAGPADSAIFNVENGVSIAVDMAKQVRLENGQKHRGVYWTRGDKSPGSRKTGWELMRKMLQEAKNPRRENPGLFIFSNCVQFERTVPKLPRDPWDTDDVDTDAEDHIADETRYRIRASGQRTGSGRHKGMF